jgi:hypothetical protein
MAQLEDPEKAVGSFQFLLELLEHVTFRVVKCNIPGCEARNRENTEVCIVFMNRKTGKFLRF